MPADTRWFSLDDIEKAAQNTLTKEHADFFAGAAGDESTLRSNRDAFERIRLRPRVLRDVSSRSTGITLLGRHLDTPVIVSPTAFHRLAIRTGDRHRPGGRRGQHRDDRVDGRHHPDRGDR